LSQEDDSPEQLICRPFLPCLVWVFDVAAQPAIASTAIRIKIRFIAFLVAFPNLVPGSGFIRFRFEAF
jgi:hypothetical protein